MDDAGDVSQDCEQDVDEQVSAASALQEDAQRWKDDGEYDLADIATGERHLGDLWLCGCVGVWVGVFVKRSASVGLVLQGGRDVVCQVEVSGADGVTVCSALSSVGLECDK